MTSVTALAYGPYTMGSAGYDVSYPQCSATTAPSGAFGIVGVNGGRPFTKNSCFAREYGQAPQSPLPSAYINTGYSGAYRKNITTACSSAPATITGSAARQAWSIGCSEADTSLTYAENSLATTQNPASVWWLDVEVGNSWSSSNLTLNQNTIQGALDRLTQSSTYVGVYSTAGSWTTITGGSFVPNGFAQNPNAGDWVAGGSCSTPFITGTKVWLAQSTSGGIDYDTAC